MITIDTKLQKMLNLFPEEADIKRVVFSDKIKDRERTVKSFSKVITITEIDEEERRNLSWFERQEVYTPKLKYIDYIKTDSIHFEFTDDSLSLEEHDRNKLICTIYYKRKEGQEEYEK